MLLNRFAATPATYSIWSLWYNKFVFQFATQQFKTLNIKIYRTIILPVVLYGCVTWSIILRENRRLRVLQNRVLRRIFGPTRNEVTGEWRKLHNEDLNDLYFSPNIVRVIKSGRLRWALCYIILYAIILCHQMFLLTFVVSLLVVAIV